MTLTLKPLGGYLPSNWLPELGTGRVDVPYPCWMPSAANVAAGADALNAALHQYPGYDDVYGHSMGAECIDNWLSRYGPSSDIDPANVTFWGTGDPERPGGRGGYPGATKWVPADTRYKYVNITRQGDFFSDGGNFWTGFWIHLSYGNVRINDPAPLSKTVAGNITLMTVA